MPQRGWVKHTLAEVQLADVSRLNGARALMGCQLAARIDITVEIDNGSPLGSPWLRSPDVYCELWAPQWSLHAFCEHCHVHECFPV